MTGEALVQIPGATVYQVERSSHAVTSIANGDFIIAYAAPVDDAELEAQVGSVRWALGRWVASLRFDDLTYAFQLPPPAEGAAQPAAAGAAAAAAAGPAGRALGWCYFCLTLHPDTPLELIDLMQAVLASGTAYHDYQHLQQQQQPVPEPAGPRAGAPLGEQPQPQAGAAAAAAAGAKADRIAAGLQRGGQLAAAGVLAAAAWAGAALQRGADHAVTRMQPSDRQHTLSPEAQARLERAKSMAAQAAEVSGRAVAGALSVTAQVAGHLAQRISESDLGRQMSRARVAGASAQDLRKVGVAGVEAAEAVYDSLADAARIVLAHTHAAATRVAGHKYGPGAAQAAGAGIAMAQSVVEAGLNVYKLRPTALVKGAFKGTAKNVVLGSNGGNQLQQPQSQQGYPGSRPPGPAAAAERSGASSSSSGGSAAVTSPPPAALPPVTAAVSTLAAVAVGGPPHAQQQQGGAAAAAAGLSYSGGAYGHPGTGVAGGPVVQGVPVTGPVVGQPVTVDYTPSVAAFQDATGAAAATVAGGGSQGLPYPSFSAAQYTARYYPAVPRV